MKRSAHAVTDAMACASPAAALAKLPAAGAAAPLAPAIDPAVLAQEIASLPASASLMRVGEFEVLCTPAQPIPALMQEIGRLREWAFRLVGEGTGRASDLDAFDAHYEQLFVWHHSERKLLGAYRLGFTQDINQRQGVAGLYTHSLFEFDNQMLARLGPSIELGRSFVHPQFQGSSRALRLLWAGIAVVLERHPQVACLFGPVSISSRYSRLGRALMLRTLQLHHMDADLHGLIRARRAPDGMPGALAQRITEASAGLGDPKRLSRVLERIEHGMGLPMLIKHYIELRGRFAAFSVDAAFNQTLDGLVFVRVADIPPRFRTKLTAAAHKLTA